MSKRPFCSREILSNSSHIWLSTSWSTTQGTQIPPLFLILKIILRLKDCFIWINHKQIRLNIFWAKLLILKGNYDQINIWNGWNEKIIHAFVMSLWLEWYPSEKDKHKEKSFSFFMIFKMVIKVFLNHRYK